MTVSFYISFFSFIAVTTLKQRHACQEFQPEIITDLHPRHKYFSVKRSLRCRVSYNYVA